MTSFILWLTAWSSFLMCMSKFFPHQIFGLLQYQAYMVDLGSQFTFPSIYAYDRAFRLSMAQNPSNSWGTVDDRLYNRHLRAAPLQQKCFSCNNFGHYSSNCPQRSSNSTSVSQASTPAPLSSTRPPFHVPQRAFPGGSGSGANTVGGRSCYHFNWRRCTVNPCPFPHVCSKCGEAHPRINCKRN